MKNACDNQSGFTYLGSLGDRTQAEPILDVFLHPRGPRLVVKLDVYGAAGGYANTFKTDQSVIYIGRYFCEKCL